MGLDLKDKINQIIDLAERNDYKINTSIVIDILKDREEQIGDDQIDSVIRELKRQGIALIPEADEGYSADEADLEAFIPAEVNISQKPITVYSLMERLANNEIDLKPSFQRQGGLWSMEEQSRLIESLMLKIPIPAFYFNASDEDKWIVIDGLQRLTAFQNYLVGSGDDCNGEKKTLTGLQYLKDFNGLTFDDLPRQYIRRIKETALIAFTVEKGTPDEVVFNIFQRINTGGVQLNPQEIRQALYQGSVTRLIQRMAESEEFLTATQGAISTERMLDREYALRFLAFTLLDYKKEYKGNIDNFLIKAMKLVNTYDEKQLERIEESFKRIMVYCNHIFGKYAFRRVSEQGRRGRVNKAIFEMWSVCFSELNEQQMYNLIAKRKAFLERFALLQKDREFIADLRSGKQTSAVRRIDMARNLVKEFIC